MKHSDPHPPSEDQRETVGATGVGHALSGGKTSAPRNAPQRWQRGDVVRLRDLRQFGGDLEWHDVNRARNAPTSGRQREHGP